MSREGVALLTILPSIRLSPLNKLIVLMCHHWFLRASRLLHSFISSSLYDWFMLFLVLKTLHWFLCVCSYKSFFPGTFVVWLPSKQTRSRNFGTVFDNVASVNKVQFQLSDESLSWSMLWRVVLLVSGARRYILIMHTFYRGNKKHTLHY